MDWGGSNNSGTLVDRSTPRNESGWCIEMNPLSLVRLSKYEIGLFIEREEAPYKVFRTDLEYAVPTIFSEALQHLDYLEQTPQNSPYFLKVLNPE